MKNYLKYITVAVISVFMISCQEDDASFGELTMPSNLNIEVTYLDDTNNDGIIDENDSPSEAPGLGSGRVQLNATADDAIYYQFIYNGAVSVASSGEQTYNFAVLGENTYSITAIAFGPGGVSTVETIDIQVLSLYEPPAELITMLTNDSSRTWRIANDTPGHFGLGPVGGILNEFYGANPNDKVGVGMYDDRYTFNVDGTFTHDVGEDGEVFGRAGLIEELNGQGTGNVNGADIENYPYETYQEQWFITAPAGNETLNLTGIGFLGYYIGGDHTYIIESRSANEMILRSTDGNGEFDWGFILIAEE
ncbi:glucan endo-1,3-beta-D-glucosidase [Winogradskyella sp.]|uniref:glucan endo-1,3-beta-D-glucosidase n=1 Tax=Winogradskyella sp. TaxID=1883156 RepID=UPI003F6D6D11